MQHQFEGIAARGQIVPFVFVQDNLAASQTDVALNIQEVASATALLITGLSMPWSGSIVGVSVDTSSAATAGTLTVTATIDGTKQADTAQSITTATAASVVVPQSKVQFAAAQKLGVKISTSAGWDATTADLAVIVYVLLDCQQV